jgi:hypothetical protein
MRISRCFNRLFYSAVAVQIALWAVFILLPGRAKVFGNVMYAAYGGWLVEIACNKFVPYTEANIGAGYFMFMLLVPCLIFAYAFVIAWCREWVNGA